MIEELPEDLRRYAKIALAMNKFPIGKSITISELAKEAGVHQKTAEKAIVFFLALKKVKIPLIVQEGKKFIFKRC